MAIRAKDTRKSTKVEAALAMGMIMRGKKILVIRLISRVRLMPARWSDCENTLQGADQQKQTVRS